MYLLTSVVIAPLPHFSVGVLTVVASTVGVLTVGASTVGVLPVETMLLSQIFQPWLLPNKPVYQTALDFHRTMNKLSPAEH